MSTLPGAGGHKEQLMKKKDRDQLTRGVLRGYLGVEETPAPAPVSDTERMSKRALEVWNFMLSKSGFVPNIGDK
jgi:hypothetical protein